VRADQHRQHAGRLVVLDEAHASHVGRQVVGFAGARAGPAAVGQVLQIQPQVFHVVETLMPFVERLAIDRPQMGVPATTQRGDQMSADKAARSRDNDAILAHVRSSLKVSAAAVPSTANGWLNSSRLRGCPKRGQTPPQTSVSRVN
jgi:hypothetical protein